VNLGDTVRYTVPKSGRVVEGRIVEVDTLDNSMLSLDSGEVTSGSRYKIKQANGRSVWTRRFADKSE